MGNLSAFMKQEFKRDKVVEIPGFDRFKDEKGNPIPFKVRVLDYNKDIKAIREMYRSERIAYDKKTKKPIVDNGELVKNIDFDNDKATANIIVEALEYPNLKDPELMKFYDCDEYIDMPLKVFTPVEHTELMRRIWIVLGMIKPDDDEDVTEFKTVDEKVETVKNS